MPNLLNLAELSRLLSNPVALSLHRSMEKAGAVSGATGEPTSAHPDEFPPPALVLEKASSSLAESF